MLNDHEILVAVQAEAEDAIDYKDEIGKKRSVLLKYYNGEPYGDEVDGRSRFISSDVSDVVEWMLPSLLRVFTQGHNVAQFRADTEEAMDEAEQKTMLANYVFFRQNDGVLTLHNMFKDALLQYTGVVKVSWKEDRDVTYSSYKGLSQDEYAKLKAEDGIKILEEESREALEGRVWDVQVERTSTWGRIDYKNIPPEEFVICRDARDFRKPRMIGHRPPTTRSDLIQMGFSKDVVNSLPTKSGDETSTERYNRRHDLSDRGDDNPTTVRANDKVDFGEYYVYLDVDEDGVSELWQVFVAGNRILEKNRWDRHPFACLTPVPLPHRAIGTCPADQAADLQYVHSVLVRQALDNIYSTNYQRMAYNDRVDLDDLFTPRPGGGIHVDGEQDIGGALTPITTIPQTDGILGMVEYMNSAREIRTGVTRYNQGLDSETLNKTATGFRGIMDASQQRMELIARVFAETGVRELFRLTAMLLTKYQKDSVHVRVTGRVMEVDPTGWSENLDVLVDVGLGSGDRNEKISNLGFILQQQELYKQQGSLLADDKKSYNALEKIVTEIGLKDVDEFFNDPERPEAVLLAENEQLKAAVTQLSQQNPLAEAEMVKAKAKLAEVDAKEITARERLKMEEASRAAELDLAEKELMLKARQLELQREEAEVDAQLKAAQRAKALADAEAQEIENDAVESGVLELSSGQ